LKLQESARLQEEDFNKLFSHYNSKIYDVANYYVRNKEIAEEIVTDVFIKIWERVDLEKIQNLDSYLYISTKNHALNYLNKEKRFRRVGLDDVSSSNYQDMINPERLMVLNEAWGKADEAVESLPSRCKTIYKLIRRDGKRYKQVSALLGISVKTIEAQIRIALKRLDHQMSDYSSEFCRSRTA
jgi:RNA polymerase sigma-70 factor (ECF subfamily)